MAVLLVLVRPIVGIMSTPAEAVEGTVRYLTICFIGIPFITAYNIISSIFRGWGILRVRCILKVGVPVCLQDGFSQVSFVVITIFANQRGLTDAAAVGIVEKIISILFLVPSSMMSTISALVAQNIGAGKHDRAKLTLKYVLMITVTYGLIMTIIVQFVSVPLVGLFTNDGAVAVSEAGYLRSYASVHFKDTLFPMGCAAPAGSLISVVICVGVFIWLEHHEDKYQNISGGR